MNERVVIFAVFIFAVLFAVALAFTLSPVKCEGYLCFQQHMASCTRATYVNEDPEASWLYEIKAKTQEGCAIDVTLLNAKEGELGLRDLEGQSMTCTYELGMVGYPDKDMSLCTGKLKESLQNIIIEKLHKYIINNLQDLKDALDAQNGA